MAIALIVGGSRPGIGQALVARFASEGYELIATIEASEAAASADFVASRPDVKWLELDLFRMPVALRTWQSTRHLLFKFLVRKRRCSEP